MEIIKSNISKNIIVLSVKGRLDAYWSGHLEKELDEILHSDIHDIRLNLENIQFISSAGIRVLLNYYKKLKSINGNFSIVKLSQEAKNVIELAGLIGLINTELAQDTVSESEQILEEEGRILEFVEKNQKNKLRLNLLGTPKLPLKSNLEVIHNYKFNNDMIGLGIGELSGTKASEKNMAGEFLALAGTGAYLPTDGSNTPDYIVESHNLLPEFNILYGLTVTGQLQKQFRFKSNQSDKNFELSEIINVCRKNSSSSELALIIIAETSGLVGASLKSDPRNYNEPNFFEFPDIRKNISFSSESIFKRYLTISAGVIGNSATSEKIKIFLRPLSTDKEVYLHIHTLPFPFISLSKDENDYKKIVKIIFDAYPPESLIHLLTDSREINGIGESKFTRGVCWFGEIK